MSMSINVKSIQKLEDDLKEFNRKAYPFATRNTVNRSAFLTRERAKRDVKRDMIQRNKWTVNSIRHVQTRTLKVNDQEAIVGSLQEYMATQEFGGLKKPAGEGVVLPTSASSGEGKAAPRRRLPRPANKLRRIRLSNRKASSPSRKQRNAIKVSQALKEGRKFVYIDTGRRKGIFRLMGGKRNTRLVMMYDLTRKSVVVPRNPWLAPAVKKIERKIPDIYRESLQFQLRRLGIF